MKDTTIAPEFVTVSFTKDDLTHLICALDDTIGILQKGEAYGYYAKLLGLKVFLEKKIEGFGE